jgi:hypothetical protein
MWTPDESRSADDEFMQQFSEFVQAASEHTRPRFVPSRVITQKTIRNDIPGNDGILYPGEHDVTHNQWGAISGLDQHGRSLGICPSECIVLQMSLNKYLEQKATT